MPDGGTTDVAVSAVAFKDKLYLFSKGIGDKHIYINSSTNGSSWSGAKELPGGGTTDVALGSAVTGWNHLCLMAKGIDDKGIYVYTTNNGQSWNSQENMGGPTGTSLAGTRTNFDKNFYFFYVNSLNNRIYCRFWLPPIP